MIGLDTNVLARYYVDDRADAEATRQREVARRILESGQPLMACKTVLLELEWVLRGYYQFRRGEVFAVFRHLLSMPNVTLEDRQAIEQAVALGEAGLDFADAVHHASYAQCTRLVSFDDRGFARKARRLRLTPQVTVPS